jgi:hypothetical protein
VSRASRPRSGRRDSRAPLPNPVSYLVQFPTGKYAVPAVHLNLARSAELSPALLYAPRHRGPALAPRTSRVEIQASRDHEPMGVRQRRHRAQDRAGRRVPIDSDSRDGGTRVGLNRRARSYSWKMSKHPVLVAAATAVTLAGCSLGVSARPARRDRRAVLVPPPRSQRAIVTSVRLKQFSTQRASRLIPTGRRQRTAFGVTDIGTERQRTIEVGRVGIEPTTLGLKVPRSETQFLA